MALGEAQLVSSLYTPQRLGSIAQKLNGTNRLIAKTREKHAKNTRKRAKTREKTRKTREKHANRPAIKRKTRKAPDKNSENNRKTRNSCHFYKNHIFLRRVIFTIRQVIIY